MSASKINVTYDDFDPLIVYSDYSQWQTPNPQDNPTWYNATEDVTGVPWHQATIHSTTTQGASFAFNFTTTAVWIYGAAGPSADSSNVTVTLDGTPTTISPTNTTDAGGRTLLWSQQGLEEGKVHNVEVQNEGSGVGVDMVVLEYDIGSGVTNTTMDDATLGVRYQGYWTINGGDFFNGTSSYTQGPGNMFSFNFTGSAVYIYGDQVNDHGPFSLYFNDSSTPYGTWNARSGCGTSAYEKSCEKLGSLKAFVGGLPPGEHEATIVNGGPEGDEATYFDFDYLEYSTPSTYPSFTIDATCANGVCADGETGGSGNTTSTASASAGTTSTTAGASSGGVRAVDAGMGTGILWAVLGVWAVRRLGWA
ncbi:hypothetical protein IAT38_003063 [Cryptococcus sp. DSM 104549]